MRTLLPLILVLSAPVATAESLSSSVGLLVYPAGGQSSEQSTQDDYQCFAWAKEQTGFDPMTAQAPAAAEPTPQGADGSAVRGGLRGAARGAILGEVIDDDASKGAEIGAAVGAMRGRSTARAEQAQQQTQQATQGQAEFAAQQSRFKDAMSLCLENRGYSVK